MPTDVKAYSAQVAKEIAAGRLPRLNFVLVGVGDQVDEEQMEEICHATYPGRRATCGATGSPTAWRRWPSWWRCWWTRR